MKIIEEKIIMSKTKTKLSFVRFFYVITNFFRKLFNLPTENVFISRKGIKWEVDLNEAIDFCLYLTGDYEPELIKAYSPIVKDKDFHIIDIGANIGAHTLNFAKLISNKGKVYAIEPTNFAFEKLVTNIHHNEELKNKIETHQVLLTNNEGHIGISEISSSWNIAEDIESIKRNQFDGGFAQATTKARSTTLDQLVNDLKIEQIDLIKLDVDGNEVDILKGATETFAKFRPILLVELSPIHFDNKNQPYRFSDQVEILKELNYEFHDILGKK
jgi:FkbM family methyltransferase